MSSFEAEAESSAPPQTIWNLLLDSATWPQWSRVDALDRGRSEQLDPGGHDGVGAVRAFRTGRLVARERITALEPPLRFVYEGADNPELSHYQAAIELTPTERGGTAITWRGTFRARRGRSWFMQWYMRRFMQSMADGLAAHAARH
jgi:uncharacterized protein YndB with AHSA1/START domain